MASNITNVNRDLASLNLNTAKKNFDDAQFTKGNGSISKDGFLRLMLAQMKYQNPLEPTDSTAQLQQQAAFTQIEELQKLNGNVTQSTGITQASNFVGKQVTYKPLKEPGALDEPVPVTGRVDSALFTNEGIKLIIGGKQVSPNQVTELKVPTT
jgi:flagellar basal-body rod modification protein FlgD